jgi:hypothetical protein
VYLLACRPGQTLRIEGFPMGTSPTWARLLSAPETGGPETGSVFWPFDTPGWRLVRKEQRQWLRDKGLTNVLPGLHLDEPDDPAPAPLPAPVVLVPEAPPPAPAPAPAAKPRSKPARPAGSGSPALRPGPQILEPEASGIDASDPFVGLDAGAEEPEDPPALRTLLSQLDRRFPYRWRGGADGLTRAQNGVPVLWVTDDKGRIGENRTGPGLEALKRCVRADARAERADWVSDPDGVRYLAVIVRSDPAKSQDPSAWDLSGLDEPARRAS